MPGEFDICWSCITTRTGEQHPGAQELVSDIEPDEPNDELGQLAQDSGRHWTYRPAVLLGVWINLPLVILGIVLGVVGSLALLNSIPSSDVSDLLAVITIVGVLFTALGVPSLNLMALKRSESEPRCRIFWCAVVMTSCIALMAMASWKQGLGYSESQFLPTLLLAATLPTLLALGWTCIAAGPNIQFSIRQLGMFLVYISVFLGITRWSIRWDQIHHYYEQAPAAAYLDQIGGVRWVDWQVTTLYLRGSSVTSQDLTLLRQLPAVRYLNLDSTVIGDAGLEQVALLEHLEILILNRTLVTDAGLEHLSNLTSLQVVELSGTSVTLAGMERLHEKHPHCTIVGDPATWRVDPLGP